MQENGGRSKEKLLLLDEPTTKPALAGSRLWLAGLMDEVVGRQEC